MRHKRASVRLSPRKVAAMKAEYFRNSQATRQEAVKEARVPTRNRSWAPFRSFTANRAAAKRDIAVDIPMTVKAMQRAWTGKINW